MAADAGLRKLLSGGLKPHGHWLQAIETGATSAGLPDCHALCPTGTYWLECKKTSGWAVKFEPHQLMWWRRHAPHVRGFIAVRTLGVGSSGGTGDGLAIFPGGCAEELERLGVAGVTSILRIQGPSRSWAWARIAEILSLTDTRSAVEPA